MGKSLGKPNARGDYRVEKAGVTFWIGKEEREALRRKGAIEALFKSIGETWDCPSLEVAKAIARGDKSFTVDPPPEYIGHPDRLARSLQLTQSEYPWIKIVYAGDVAEEAKRGEIILADFHARKEAEASRQLELVRNSRDFGNGQRLYEAFAAYCEATKQKYVSLEDGMPTEYALTEERQIEFIKRHFADMPLTKFDLGAIDSLRIILQKRPQKKNGKPIASITARHLIRSVSRFVRWLHKSPNFTWRKPEDYEVEYVRIPQTNAEKQARLKPIPTYTDDQIKTLFSYATPPERVLLLLGLNCGFKQAEALGICIDEINLAEKLLGRVRFKTNVPGQWRLWDVTCLALDWAMKRRPDQSLPVLIQTTHGKRIGTALGKRTKSGNRGGRIANFWRALYKRIRKDEKSFPFLPYSTLRDTGASAIRSIAGGEIAEMYLSHGNPIPDGALLESYANKPWAKLHDALTVWGDRLAEAFKVDDPFPAEYRRAANIALSKKTIEKIAELRNQGYKLKTIADKVGCSFYAVRTYQNA